MGGLRFWLFLFLWVLLLSSVLSTSSFTAADLAELEDIPAQVIVTNSPCSATCGLGIRTQELCPLEGSQVGTGEECHIRKVRCLESWQCGLQAVTMPAGGHLELDCLGEVMKAMGRFSFLVSWRYARGVVTTDDSLFGRWDAPSMDRVVLDPLREEDAGTYRCDVHDTAHRRVKRVYKGVRVLPAGVLNLDFTNALANWDRKGESYPNITVVSGPLYTRSTVKDMLLWSLIISGVIAVLALYCLFLMGRSTIVESSLLTRLLASRDTRPEGELMEISALGSDQHNTDQRSRIRNS